MRGEGERCRRMRKNVEERVCEIGEMEFGRRRIRKGVKKREGERREKGLGRGERREGAGKE